jgi:hypothetical protein
VVSDGVNEDNTPADITEALPAIIFFIADLRFCFAAMVYKLVGEYNKKAT